MRLETTLAVLSLAVIVHGSSASAQTAALPPAPAYSIRPATGAITVDGVLNEDAWREAQPIPLSWETAPGDNVTPPAVWGWGSTSSA
jgi:hypothetical protein